MPKYTALLFFSLFIVTSIVSQTRLPEAPDDKAVIYFVRPNGLGALVNFSYFDGEKLIAKFNAPKYFRYECDPGEHLFWVRSENREFIEANVEAGKNYMIEAIPRMGGFKTSVKLAIVDPKVYKMKRIDKLIERRQPETFTEAELAEKEDNLNEIIARGMEKYNKLKAEGKEIMQLTPDMEYKL